MSLAYKLDSDDALKRNQFNFKYSLATFQKTLNIFLSVFVRNKCQFYLYKKHTIGHRSWMSFITEWKKTSAHRIQHWAPQSIWPMWCEIYTHCQRIQHVRFLVVPFFCFTSLFGVIFKWAGFVHSQPTPVSDSFFCFSFVFWHSN